MVSIFYPLRWDEPGQKKGCTEEQNQEMSSVNQKKNMQKEGCWELRVFPQQVPSVHPTYLKICRGDIAVPL